MPNRIIIRIVIAVVILVGIGGYALYESRNLLRGPIVTIDEPLNGATFQTPVADIKGKVQNTAHISMNDRNISIDENGVFDEKFVLSDGSNVVKVSATDRFGRTADTFVEVLYNKPSGTLSQGDSRKIE